MHYKYRYDHFFDGIERTDFKKLSENLCIYGAGFQGLLAAHLLDKAGVNVLCFCDMDVKKQGKTYYGLPIYAPEKMKELYPDATVIVTPYSLAPAYRYVIDELGYQSVVTPFSLFLEFDSDEFDKLDELPEWYHADAMDFQIDAFMRICINVITKYTLLATDISVTEKCNLRCKDCTSLMPCYENPRHYKLEDVISEFERYSAGRMIHHVNIEGGEAFVWPYLAEFVKYLCAKDNVMNVYLVSNGTIIPNETLIEALKNEKVTLRISDYGELTKLQQLKEIYERNGIKYKFLMQRWYELSAFHKKPVTGDEYKAVVDSCCKIQPCGNGTNYIMGGKLFHCPIQANMHNLGFFRSLSTDYVDLTTERPELSKEVDDFIGLVKIPELCKFCVGRTYVGKEVPPAVQLKANEKIIVRFE